MKRILLSIFVFSSILSCKDASQKTNDAHSNTEPDLRDKIAIANGLNEFEEIDKLEFTFNVKTNDTLRTSRNWQWNLQTNQIQLTEKDTTRTYTKTDSVSSKNEYIDQRFVNDSYWLLFPFHIKWSDADISKITLESAPISGKEMQKITVSYPAEGGYTPGDKYDVYFNDDFIIQEWVYKSADGARELATTWEDYQTYKGLKIAGMHRSKDGKFQLFFTDVEVE